MSELKWTKERPKVRGWYGVRVADDLIDATTKHFKPEIFWFNRELGEIRDLFTGRLCKITDRCMEQYEFCGPIELPE